MYLDSGFALSARPGMTVRGSTLLGDGFQHRIEARHLGPDMGVEAVEPDIPRLDALDPDLGDELRILARLGHRLIERGQHGLWRLARRQHAVPGAVLVIETL